jgi:hypothetical protein
MRGVRLPVLVSANLYPWDVDGDAAAADRIAGLGLASASDLAAIRALCRAPAVRGSQLDEGA